MFAKSQEEKIREYIFTKPSAIKARVLYFESDFVDFMLYYFPREFYHDLAPFQVSYSYDLQGNKNVLFEGFRECAKSMILRYYYVYCICYRKRKFIMHYNDSHAKAKKMLLSIIIILEKNKKIIRDFGHLYIPAEGRQQRDPSKKSVAEFITTNQIMMKAMSPGMSPRWESFYSNDGETFRPDLVWFDDLDTIYNVKNVNIIEEAVEFILNEVIGWVDAFCQLIFLGNTISEDGRVPRLKKHFQSSPELWVKIYWIPIRQKGKIVWDRFVATDAEAEKLNKDIVNSKAKFIPLEMKRRMQWSIWYNANFNLVAYKKGQKIIKESDIKYYTKLPNNYRIVIGIDPAFSLKTNTDPIGIWVTAHESFEGKNYKYVIELKKLEADEKDEDRFCAVIVGLYQRYNVNIVYIEGNNGWDVLARMLKKRWLAIKIIDTKKDKVTRVRENQADIERWLVLFNPDISMTAEWVQQILAFPNAEHDDMVDWFINSLLPPEIGQIRTM